MVSPAATVEQAEPQGSAAPAPDIQAPAPGDSGAATPESFGAHYRQHVEERAARMGDRAAATGPARGTSARDEQSAPDGADVSRPGAADPPADGDGPPTATTRAQRKALKASQAEGSPSVAAAPTAPEADDDPVVARVERVERTVTEGLTRLEGLLARPTPAEADPAEDPASKAYRAKYGADEEFARRSQVALHGQATGQYLPPDEAEELTAWALRREGRDDGSRTVSTQYQSSFSAMVQAAAEAYGVSPEAISKPGTTFRDIFGAFVDHGSAKQDADLAAERAKSAQLEAANRQLADDYEALQRRLPGASRSVLAGGAGGATRAAALADRSRMSGRQLMASGLAQQAQGRPARPGAR